MAIDTRQKKRKDAVGTPLTESVQENFRGFTFSGESMHPDSWLSASARQAREEEEEEVLDDDDQPDPDDVDDDSAHAGRYARRRDMDMDG